MRNAFKTKGTKLNKNIFYILVMFFALQVLMLFINLSSYSYFLSSSTNKYQFLVERSSTIKFINVNPSLNAIGEKIVLEARLNTLQAGPKNLYWFSDNPEVATVDEFGIVTSTGNGKCNITVKTDDGDSATIPVYVIDSFQFTIDTTLRRRKWKTIHTCN